MSRIFIFSEKHKLKNKIFFWVILLFPTVSQAQMEQRMLLSTAIKRNIPVYNYKSELAFHQNDMEQVHFLFDSLVNNVIKGSRMDNFQVHKKNGRLIHFDRFQKPLFIITYSSWYPLKEGEIKALNQIAKEYRKDIKFIALFWENRIETKRISKKFSRNVEVLYADEGANSSDGIIKSVKYSLGVPTAIFTDSDRVILDVGRLPANVLKEEIEESFNRKYSYFKSGVETILKSL